MVYGQRMVETVGSFVISFCRLDGKDITVS